MVKGFIGFVMALTVIMFLAWGAVMFFAADTIQENGGIKNTLIEFGKDAKDIMREVQEHESEDD